MCQVVPRLEKKLQSEQRVGRTARFKPQNRFADVVAADATGSEHQTQGPGDWSLATRGWGDSPQRWSLGTTGVERFAPPARLPAGQVARRA